MTDNQQDTLAIIGVVISVAGIVISAWQAWVARNAARDAGGYRDDILRLKRGFDCADLLEHAGTARDAARKLRSVASGTVGTNPERFLANLEEFVHRIHLSNLGEQIDGLPLDCEEITKGVASYRQARQTEDQMRIAQALFDRTGSAHIRLSKTNESNRLPPPKE